MFIEIGYAFVEINGPTFDTAHINFVGANGPWHTGFLTDLAIGAKVICTKFVTLLGNQRHVGQNSTQAEVRTKSAIDDGAVFAQFTKSTFQSRGNLNECCMGR